MRASLPVRVLRSVWLYILVAIAGLMLTVGVLGRWSYDNNDWVRFHVQEIIAQVHGLVTSQPSVVPTPSILAAAPTFAPIPTSIPPTATATTAATATGQAAATNTAAPTVAPSATPVALPRHVTLTGFHHEY